MILVPFFASSTGYGSTKNLLSLPFQAPVFFALLYRLLEISTSWVFLGADAQVLGTSLADTRMPSSIGLKSLLKLNIRHNVYLGVSNREKNLARF